MKELLQRSISRVDAETWKNFITHTVKVEDRLIAIDNVSDNVTENILGIFNMTDSGTEVSTIE